MRHLQQFSFPLKTYMDLFHLMKRAEKDGIKFTFTSLPANTDDSTTIPGWN